VEPWDRHGHRTREILEHLPDEALEERVEVQLRVYAKLLGW